MIQNFIRSTKYAFSLTCLFAFTSNAAIIQWADWQSGTQNEVLGQIVTSTSTVDLTYTNQQGYAFLQTGSGIDYFNNHEDPAKSPYTSAIVENIPTASEMIALRYAGSQTLTFSETIANPVFSYVSLNGNGYAFDQDFEILSFGDGVDNFSGYWGSGGTSYKQVVDIGGGVMEYRLLGTGEPHGTIRFTGAFDTVSWGSLTSENWNGFTVGIEGTAAEVFVDVPEPSTLAILSLALIGLVRRKAKK